MDLYEPASSLSQIVRADLIPLYLEDFIKNDEELKSDASSEDANQYIEDFSRVEVVSRYVQANSLVPFRSNRHCCGRGSDGKAKWTGLPESIVNLLAKRFDDAF